MGTKGYSYTVEDDKLREYMKLTTKEKLEWLEEITTLTELTLSENERKFRELLRAGKI
jgi:hypothetical protein